MKGESAVKVKGHREGEGSPIWRKANGCREGEGSLIQRKANGCREGEGSPIRRKANALSRFEGRRTVVGKAKGRRFERRRTPFADLNEGERPLPIRMKANSHWEGERSPVWRKAKGCRFKGMRRVADSKEGKRSPRRRRVAGAIWSGYRCVYLRWRAAASPLSLIGDGGLGFFGLLFVFFFFFLTEMAQRVLVLKCLWLGIEIRLLSL